MENSKVILHKERREVRAKDVLVKLTSSTTTGYMFGIYKDEDAEKSKYVGNISEDHLSDDCTCKSFEHGNDENYIRENPLPFQCKHIIAAHELMEEKV